MGHGGIVGMDKILSRCATDISLKIQSEKYVTEDPLDQIIIRATVDF